jgi:hypothetical protein
MTSARRQLVPLPSNLNTGKGPTPQGHPCFSFRPLEQLKGKTALKGKWAEMKGNDRQIKISPPSPSASLSSHLLTRSHMQSDHFFSYDSATTVGPIGPISAAKKYFTATTVVRFPATISPTTVGRKLLRGDAGRRSRIQIAGFSLPLLRSQSEHGRKLAQSCSRTKLSPGNPPSLPRRRSQIQNRLLSRLLPRPFFDLSRNTIPSWPKATAGTIGTP